MALYVMTDANASFRLTRRIDGIAQVQNLGNTYQQRCERHLRGDRPASKAGLQIRF